MKTIDHQNYHNILYALRRRPAIIRRGIDTLESGVLCRVSRRTFHIHGGSIYKILDIESFDISKKEVVIKMKI